MVKIWRPPRNNTGVFDPDPPHPPKHAALLGFKLTLKLNSSLHLSALPRYITDYIMKGPDRKHCLSIPSLDATWLTEFLPHFAFGSLCLWGYLLPTSSYTNFPMSQSSSISTPNPTIYQPHWFSSATLLVHPFCAPFPFQSHIQVEDGIFNRI